MNTLKFALINIIATLLRFIPLPHKIGIIKIGNPNKNSPVFLTCNYSLTVERVKRSLRKIDCFLLVANSHGINVWCASTGGHFTNHSVISAIKTSGIESLVDHRRIILPQLAASGIESRVIKEKTGWQVIWGPVYARDIPHFLKNGFRKTPEIRQVKFPLSHRIEMALMWAFPFSMLSGGIFLLLWKSMVLPVIALTWVLPFLVFSLFPLYEPLLTSKKTAPLSKYTVIFDFAFPSLLIWITFLIFLGVFTALNSNFTWMSFLRWGLLSLVVILIISIDLMGSTPTYKSSLHKDKFFEVFLNVEKCHGEGVCVEVCPKNCFRIDEGKQKAVISSKEQCVRCGACIVQCPFDALCFKNPHGEVITPQTIRKFKLNLMGERAVPSG